MKCFGHPENDATATCQGCGKGLCADCTARFRAVLCESCLLAHNQGVARQVYTGLATTVVLFGASLYFLGGMRATGGGHLGLRAWMPALLLSFTYWGWRFLSQHAPRLSGGSGGVWLIYFLLKFSLSMVLGIVVGPYQIFRLARELYIAKKAKRQIARGEI